MLTLKNNESFYMKTRLIILCFLGFITVLNSQKDYNHHNHTIHLVEFTNKVNTPYSVLKPQQYLSQRALNRRLEQRIEIDLNDLPVDPSYIATIKSMGVELHCVSKWLNAIAIYSKDTTLLKQIEDLPFVERVIPLGKKRTIKKPIKRKKVIRNFAQHIPQKWGKSLNQIAMLEGHYLHSIGCKGQGIEVAIFDGGFNFVSNMPVFDSLFMSDRIRSTHDFVQGDTYVYESSTHGTDVLSCMAANIPYFLMGTAPDAAYHLFKTEDVNGEFRVEEINWVCAAERADSLGIDVINSSLGYTSFNDTTMSYTYKDMDGKSTYISRGAAIAVNKGILVVNSAGNEGNGPWQYIGAPADAPGVISVAAVRGDGSRARFSSIGPNSNGYLKPTFAAQGYGTVVSEHKKYSTRRTSGTSFSSPVLAGMITSLKSAYPNHTNQQIIEAMINTADQSEKPDSLLGYGIPKFFSAYVQLIDRLIYLDDQQIQTNFSVFNTTFDVLRFGKPGDKVYVKMYDTLGNLRYKDTLILNELGIGYEKITLTNLSDGMYRMQFEDHTVSHTINLCKVPL